MMNIEQRAAATPDHVTKRFYAVIALFFGIICIFGGFLLGRVARPIITTNNDLMSLNLTIAADALYRKAKRISPKRVHHHNPKRIQAKLFSIFQCSQNECGALNKNNLGVYVKNSINYEMKKLLRLIYNASFYLDSLRLNSH